MYSFGADVDEVKLGASRIVYYQPRSTWLVLTNSTRQSGFGSSPRRSRKTMSRSLLLTPGGENGRAPLSMTPRQSREAPPKECTALHHPSPAWVRSKEQFRLSSDCHAEVVFLRTAFPNYSLDRRPGQTRTKARKAVRRDRRSQRYTLFKRIMGRFLGCV